MKLAIITVLVIFSLGFAQSVFGTSSPDKIIVDTSEAMIISIEGGFTGKKFKKSFDREDLRGLVFGTFTQMDQIPFEEALCVTDLPTKSMVVVDENGSYAEYFSSEQACLDDTVTYLDYQQFNRFLKALNIEFIDIDQQ